jgi:hypothetical protein
MEDNTKEIWVGKNRFHLGEDGILYVTVEGEHDRENAEAMREAFYTFLSMTDGKLNVFTDNSRDKKPSVGARAVFREMAQHEKCGKIAVFGMNPVARMLTNFVLGSSGNKHIHISDTREEALAWLRDGDADARDRETPGAAKHARQAVANDG